MTTCAEGPCSGREAEAADLVSGELRGAARASFEDHLERCAPCRALVVAQRELDARLGRLPVYKASDALPRERRRASYHLIGPVLAAAVVAAVALAPVLRNRRADLVAAAVAADALTMERMGGGATAASPLGDDLVIPWLGFVTCASRIHEVSEGVFICALKKDGPLGEAGVEAGEVLRTVEGHRVDDTRELYERLTRYHVGERIEVEVTRRDGSSRILHATLIRFRLGRRHPFDMAWSPELSEHTFGRASVLDAVLVPLSPDAARARGLEGGLRIGRTLSRDEARRTLLSALPYLFGEPGLRVGDVVVDLAARPVRSQGDFFLAIEAEQDRAPFVLTFVRPGGERHTLAFPDWEFEQSALPNGAVSREQPLVDGAALPAALVAHAEAFMRAAPALARIWPGFMPEGSPFLMLDSAGVTLLVRAEPPGPPFMAVSDPRLPPALRGRAYTHEGYPEGLGPNRFSPSYVIGSDTLPAMEPKGSTPFFQRAFYLHEAFHGFQRRRFANVEGEHRVRFGEPLLDPETVDDAFARSALEERARLREAVSIEDSGALIGALGRYLDARRARLRGHPDAEAVERSFERREGTAEFVGCHGAVAATSATAATSAADRGDEPLDRSSRILACIVRELESPLEDYPAGPEADARLMRWRLYGNGAAMALLVDRLGVPRWKERVQAGEPLDALLAEAIDRR